MKISVLAAGAALTALLLAGCGGDNSSVATATTSAGGATATTQSGSGASTTDSGSGSATTEPASDDADTTAPSFEGNSDNEFCQAARELEASDIGGALSGGEGDLKTDLENAEKAIDELKDKAPDEIKDDVNTFATGITKIKDFYAKYDYDQAKVAEAAAKDPTVLQEALAGFSDAEFTAASTRIAAYGTQVCGISDDTTETT